MSALQALKAARQASGWIGIDGETYTLEADAAVRSQMIMLTVLTVTASAPLDALSKVKGEKE